MRVSDEQVQQDIDYGRTAHEMNMALDLRDLREKARAVVEDAYRDTGSEGATNECWVAPQLIDALAAEVDSTQQV